MLARYCERCGEDGDEREECAVCGDEFCADCGTRREIESGVCGKCLRERCAHPGHDIRVSDKSLPLRCPECGYFLQPPLP